MKLIQKCGFDIDEVYISTHQEFELNDKFECNNIFFHTNNVPDDILMKIKQNISNFSKLTNDNTLEKKLFNLHRFICEHKPFNTFGTLICANKCGKLKMDITYYIVTSEDRQCQEKVYSYIFSQETDEMSNLKTIYIGRVLICFLIEGRALKSWHIWIFKARRTLRSICQVLF